MAEIDIECGHTKTTLYARGINKSCKMVTFSHLNSSNFNVKKSALKNFAKFTGKHLRAESLF